MIDDRIVSEKRVLIVDDHAELRLLVRESLGGDDGNYCCREAANGIEALEIMAEFRPRLVILDVMMPGGMDGYHVCERIKSDPEFLRCTDVILLTARAQKKDVEKGLAAQADLYLVKPFDPNELVAAVERIFATPNR